MSHVADKTIAVVLIPAFMIVIGIAIRGLPRKALWWIAASLSLACTAAVVQITPGLPAEVSIIATVVLFILAAFAGFAAFQAWKTDFSGIRLTLSVFEGSKALSYSVSLENPSQERIDILGVVQRLTDKSDAVHPTIERRQVAAGDKAVLMSITESEIAYGDQLDVEVFYKTEKGGTRRRLARFHVPETTQETIFPSGGEDVAAEWSPEDEGARSFVANLDSPAYFCRLGLRERRGTAWNFTEIAGARRTFSYDPERKVVTLSNTLPAITRKIKISLPAAPVHHVFMGWDDARGWLALAVNGVGRQASSTMQERSYIPPDLSTPKR